MPSTQFHVGKKKKPPISFSLNVIATDLPIDHPKWKAKIVFDASKFGTEADTPNFNVNKVQELLTFVSNRLLIKVVESVYYDRGNEDFCKPDELPDGYHEAIKIYNARLRKKKKARKGDSSYLDYREESPKPRKKANSNPVFIDDIVGQFLARKNRPVWDEETNVTRVTFEQMSPPTLTVETRTAVNGDKKPK
jgi:hypothetical protein